MDNLNTFARLVYGLNMLELAGSSLNITVRLCKAVLAGQAVSTYIDEEDDEKYYQEHVDHLRANYRPTHYTDVI
jgi:hypothetical protein